MVLHRALRSAALARGPKARRATASRVRWARLILRRASERHRQPAEWAVKLFRRSV
jgi:hypothetical protein